MRHNFSKTVFFLLFALNFSLLAASQEEVQRWYDEVDRVSPATHDALSAAQREELLKRVSRHKVARLDQLDKYDTTGEVGFCFGRSMTAHLIARKMGLKEDAIRKLFVIGDLRSGPNPEWRFHVTTLVKGQEDGKWHAIDPIMTPPIAPGTSIPAQKWIDVVQNVWDRPKKAFFYLSDRHTIMPDMRIFPVNKEDETGTRAVEVSFDPMGKPGFQPFAFDITRVFETDRAAEEEHFIRAMEARAENSFPFLGMSMTVIDKGTSTTVNYDFNGYFIDLLDDLRRNELQPIGGLDRGMGPGLESDSRMSVSAWTVPGRPNLHSFRIRGAR